MGVQFIRNNSKGKNLRLKAEKLLCQEDETNGLYDVHKLVHELQVHQIELEMQNEELMKSQIELQSANNKYFELYNFAPCGYFTLDTNGIIKDVNIAGTNILGIEKENLVERAFIRFIGHDSRYKFTKLIENVILSDKILKCELELLRQNKPLTVIMEMNSNIYSAQYKRSILVTIVDISELKNAEDEIKKSLQEKEVLLREINHRVKNNLQIITSLLHLQESSAADEDPVDVLKKTQGRVKSMAMVQEKLSQSPSLSKINLKNYVEKLVNDILNSYGKSETIKTNLFIEKLDVSIDTAIPVGLIINELVTNTVKYAFKHYQGTINLKITSKYDLDKFIEIHIADDGIGIPENIDPENSDSLGLQLVNSLVNQLEGKMKYNRGKGTEYILTLKIED